jgi:hypothetical protein
MGGTYSILQTHEDFLFENFKGGDRFKDVSIDWKIILKWALMKEGSGVEWFHLA